MIDWHNFLGVVLGVCVSTTLIGLWSFLLMIHLRIREIHEKICGGDDMENDDSLPIL